jgi:sirohydrochlorin ferrochelatase
LQIGVVIIAHGSRSPEANLDVIRIGECLRQTGDYPIVEVGYLELAQPDVLTAIDTCVAKGAERVILLPYFLLAGTHVRKDLPDLLRMAREKHPHIAFQMGQHLGFHPNLVDILLDRIREAKKG